MSAPVVQAFFMMYAAKTAIEGLEEGNVTKAVIGAVGAYYGYSGLESLGTQAATAEAAAAAGAADGATAAAAGELGTSAAEVAATDTAVTAAGTQELGTVAADTAATEPGMLDGLADAWSGMSGQTQGGLIQLGGGMLQGHAQEELLREKWDREERAKAEERTRRGYTAGTGILGRSRFNPRTGQWEAVSGNS